MKSFLLVTIVCLGAALAVSCGRQGHPETRVEKADKEAVIKDLALKMAALDKLETNLSDEEKTALIGLANAVHDPEFRVQRLSPENFSILKRRVQRAEQVGMGGQIDIRLEDMPLDVRMFVWDVKTQMGKMRQ